LTAPEQEPEMRAAGCGHITFTKIRRDGRGRSTGLTEALDECTAQPPASAEGAHHPTRE
jgi:hypothetical protein